MSSETVGYPVMDLSATMFDNAKSVTTSGRYIFTVSELGLGVAWPQFIRVPERGLSFVRPTRVPPFASEFESVIYTAGSLSLQILKEGVPL